MSKFSNTALCLLRKLTYPEYYFHPQPQNLEKFKQQVYDVLSEFFRVRLCDESLFNVPKEIRDSKNYRDLFSALDAYYAKHFGIGSDAKAVETCVYFDRMLHLLITNVANNFGDEFVDFSIFNPIAEKFAISFNIDHGEILGVLHSIIMQNHNDESDLLKILINNGVNVKSIDVLDNAVEIAIMNPTDDNLQKMKNVIYSWIVLNCKKPLLSINDIIMEKKTQMESNGIIIKFANHSDQIFDAWSGGKLKLFEQIRISGIPISSIAADGNKNKHFLLKFGEPKYVQKPIMRQNVRSVLFSCIINQLNIISFKMDDILIEKCCATLN